MSRPAATGTSRPRHAALLLSVLLIGGCSSFADSRDGARPEAEEAVAARVETSAPEAELTVIADTEAVASAVSTSQALFEEADVVVLAAAEDRAGVLLAASAAVGLGVPLLLEGADEPGAGLVAAELDRLGAGTVLAVGDVGRARSEQPTEDDEEREVVAVPADAGAVQAATGLEFAPGEAVAEGSEPAAVALLDGEAPTALEPEDADAAPSGEPDADPDPDAGTVPEVTRGEPLSDTLLIATGEPGSLAGIASARAAGAGVHVTGGVTDPRATAELVDALSEREDGTVIALGAGFAAEEGLDWKVATAASGAQLPGGGQLLFPGRMLVALYGHPGTGALGVLGEQGLEASIQRARDHAAPYEALVDETVVPTFEIIATVASSAAGDDGDYSAEADVEVLRPWVEAAGEAGVYVVLDLQPGRTDFVTQAERYRSLLELPHVGLALDPEWRLKPGEVHLRQIGSVGIDEVNQVVTWLADLTRDNALPQKLLVLHQFRLSMVVERERLDTSRDELAIMVHVDGQGSQPAKQDTWNALRRTAPESLYWGWKNFYDEDVPMLTPEQTITQVSPTPELITYQ